MSPNEPRASFLAEQVAYGLSVLVNGGSDGRVHRARAAAREFLLVDSSAFAAEPARMAVWLHELRPACEACARLDAEPWEEIADEAEREVRAEQLVDRLFEFFSTFRRGELLPGSEKRGAHLRVVPPKAVH